MGQAKDVPFGEFLEDYFAECDEHLTAVRRDLLTLESFVDRPDVDWLLLDKLLRSLHSIKGLSAMVGVVEAEQLAHQMESYLRALHQAQWAVTTEAVDALIAGTKMLEQVIATLRTGQPTPEVAPLMAQLEAITPSPAQPSPVTPPATSPAPLAPNVEESVRLAVAHHPDARIWCFTFTPSPALAARGITVDDIRSRLQRVGELLHAAPSVTAEGDILFEFIVASQADETDFAAWSEDGLSWMLYETPPSSPSAPLREEGSTPLLIVPSSVVRVDLARLDELMQMVGELVIIRTRLEDSLHGLKRDMPPPQWRGLQEINLALERQLRDLREGVMRVRMVPIGEVFERMRFVVRDLARESNRHVILELSGQKTEIDKMVVERMMDPLLHLVRNAVSHGLESAEERLAQGKPAEGNIALRATTLGDTVVIEVEDDGRGIDAQQIAARARSLNMRDTAAPLDADALLNVLCAPGFSTREQADRASGRGVGLSVVKETVEELGGSLALNTQVGQGTRFTIQLPLTLAIMDALIVLVGGQTFAVPLPPVREIIEVDPTSVTVMDKDEMLSYRDGVLPLVRLADLFGLEEQFERAFYALVVGSEPKWTGLAVDHLLGQREIVVRAITDPLVQVPGIAAATELGDGRPILILDVAALARVKREA
jgi:two-component system chemotaxis sensor kinase CheA